jgi:hypothetical protein
MTRTLIAAAALLAVCACTPPKLAHPRLDTGDITVPKDGPRGISVSGPGDPGFTPLRCKPVGPETVCTRDE